MRPSIDLSSASRRSLVLVLVLAVLVVPSLAGPSAEELLGDVADAAAQQWIRQLRQQYLEDFGVPPGQPDPASDGKCEPPGPLPTLPLPSLEPVHGNRVEPIYGIRPHVERLKQDIRQAKNRIYCDLYILGGRIGAEVAVELVRRHREGLDVRVIIDRHLGTLRVLRQEIRAVKKIFDHAKVPLRIAALRNGGTILHRYTEDHNKLVVIDGRITYTGGTNVTDHFFKYFDLQVRVEGPVAALVEQQFLYDWELAGMSSFSQPPDLMSTASGLLENQSAEGLSTIRLVGTGVGRQTFYGALLNAIRSARSSISVQVHQLNEDTVLDELIRAKNRGVNVRALLDPTNVDNLIPLIHSGPRVLFNAHAVVRLGEASVPVRFVSLDDGYDAYHMKLGVFDRKVLLVGSANWDYLGPHSATETVLEIAGGDCVREVADRFDTAWDNHSTTPAVGYFSRLLNYLMRLYY
ncbi:MAG: phosphatidylserine/phosphatidylglycerophosphate/cardiolipin synthase family protein [Candidatus Riflebacteria bacterium]|nr:phosphatidylserine/phosphatidylglycerophosphate/cardiolipin synthase family protein [Candidatus Riflebacteria bacterium]